MSLANTKRPGFWQALIWKDVCQLKQITSYLAVGLLAIQAMFLLLCIFGPEQARPDSMVFQWVIAGTGVMIFLLAAPAMAAGHERHEGTWAWQSSLPQSWLHSLASKSAAAVTVGSVFGIALCIIPLLTLALFQGVRPSVTATASEILWFAAVFSGIALEVAAVSLLGSLLFRETLNGILLIAAAAIAAHIGFYALVLDGLTQQYDTASLPTWIYLCIGAQCFGGPVLLAIASVVVYRWRWGAGQFRSISPRRSYVTSQRNALTQVARTTQPSLWKSQFSLGIRNLLPMKIAALALVGFFVCRPLGPTSVEGFFVISGFACFIIGLTAFGGDQSPRVAFLADHGAGPSSIFSSRIAASGLFAVAVFAAVLIVLLTTTDQGLGLYLVPIVAGPAAALYALGVYSSIKFRTTLYSFAAGLVVTLAIVILTSLVASVLSMATATQLGSAALADAVAATYEVIAATTACCLFFSACTLLLATKRSLKSWLVRAQPTGAGWYPLVCTLALAVSVVLGTTFSYLAFPSTTQTWIDQITQEELDNGSASAHAKALAMVSTGLHAENSDLLLLEHFYPPVRWAIERLLVSQHESQRPLFSLPTKPTPSIELMEPNDEAESEGEDLPDEVEKASAEKGGLENAASEDDAQESEASTTDGPTQVIDSTVPNENVPEAEAEDPAA
ncbi:MAG: hypothetical protein Aurels2KO_52630 [Aureliella sp.]